MIERKWRVEIGEEGGTRNERGGTMVKEMKEKWETTNGSEGEEGDTDEGKKMRSGKRKKKSEMMEGC